jgi:hypothetical protein
MKKLLSALVISATVLFSCSKEAKLNRKLDGEWNVTLMDNEAVASDEAMTFKFEKEKNGKGTITLTDAYSGFSFAGTYELNKDEVINAVFSFLGDEETWNFVVTEYSKDKLKLVDDEATTYELVKK